jgi:hypothetical protein
VPDDGGRHITASAIEAMNTRYTRFEERAGALPPEAAFARFTELRDALESLRARAAHSRATAAAELAGACSIADVAAVIGLTKARAQQLIGEARSHPGHRDHPESIWNGLTPAMREALRTALDPDSPGIVTSYPDTIRALERRGLVIMDTPMSRTAGLTPRGRALTAWLEPH